MVDAKYYEGTSTSTPPHAVGDLLVVVAVRWDSTSLPGLPSGWTSAHTATNIDARRVGWKIATTTNDSTGTWSNASALFVIVWPGFTSVGAASSLLSEAGTAQTPGLTLTQPGVGWVGTLGSPVSGQSGIPSGTVSRWTNGSSRVSDTDGPVSSWTARAVVNQWLAVALELIPAAEPVSTMLPVSRSAAGAVSSTLPVSRSAAQHTVTTALGVVRGSTSQVCTSLPVARGAESFGTWRELILGDTWLDAVAAPSRTLEARAELVDVKGVPVPVIIDGVPQLDLPLSAASVEFRGEQPEQFSASISWRHPWMVPSGPTHPLWGVRSYRVRLWWRIWVAGTWLEMPVCTVAIGDTSVTDDGTVSGSTNGKDVLSLLRGGYGAPLDVSGMTIDVALRAIFERCAPTLPIRVAPTLTKVPESLVLGEQDPLSDVLELAAIGYPNGTVRSDREGVVECGPRPEPRDQALDWQEGPDCPVIELARQHGIEHMGNQITVSSTHADAVGLYVTVQDDDPSSPTYVGGPMGIRPLPGIETDKATTEEGLRSLALMALGRGLHPVEDVDVTVPARPDLGYRHPVLMSRRLVGVAGIREVSSWSLALPAAGESPATMKVSMMRRTVR